MWNRHPTTTTRSAPTASTRRTLEGVPRASCSCHSASAKTVRPTDSASMPAPDHWKRVMGSSSNAITAIDGRQRRNAANSSREATHPEASRAAR